MSDRIEKAERRYHHDAAFHAFVYTVAGGKKPERDDLERAVVALERLAADGPVAVLPGGKVESGAKALLALLDAEIEATECKGASAPGISHCAECCFGTGIIATDRDDELYAEAIRHLRYTLDDEGFRLTDEGDGDE